MASTLDLVMAVFSFSKNFLDRFFVPSWPVLGPGDLPDCLHLLTTSQSVLLAQPVNLMMAMGLGSDLVNFQMVVLMVSSVETINCFIVLFSSLPLEECIFLISCILHAKLQSYDHFKFSSKNVRIQLQDPVHSLFDCNFETLIIQKI